MNKKNNKIAALIKKKHKLLADAPKIIAKLKAIEAEERKWDFAQRGPFAYQWMKFLIDSINNGQRPVSLKEIEEACQFEGEKDLMKNASIYAKREASRQKLGNERTDFIGSI